MLYDFPFKLMESSVIHLIDNLFCRRAKCFDAAALLKVDTLREVNVKDIEDKKELFAHDAVMYKRFKHVVSEIDRTVRAAEALRKKDFNLFGQLMIESHNSLR